MPTFSKGRAVLEQTQPDPPPPPPTLRKAGQLSSTMRFPDVGSVRTSPRRAVASADGRCLRAFCSMAASRPIRKTRPPG